MGVKDYFVPENFIKAMGKAIKEFNNLSAAHQAKMAFYIWMDGTNRRKHISRDGMSIGYMDLEKSLGRAGFARINGALGIFDVSANWSKVNKETKSYQLTEQVQRAVDDYLAKVEEATAFISLDGKVMRTIPKAIASLDQDDVAAIAWKEAKPVNMIRVDVDKMREVFEYLTIKKTGNLSAQEDITYLIGILKRLIILANSDVAGKGYIIHRYGEARAGRLYTKGISLQNAPKLIRRIALHGLYDYDIENCHYSIFYQLAGQNNYECEAIRDYLARKKEVREAIAREVGISLEDAKECLLALMFGAKSSTWEDNSIPQAIGQAKASTLFKHPTFKGIANELSHGKKLILKRSTKSKTTLINAMSKSISLKEPANKQLAHIIQGIEAQSLRASLALYPDEIVLLMHDGFVSKKALDVTLIGATIYEATGMKLELSGGVITLPSELDFSNL